MTTWMMMMSMVKCVMACTYFFFENHDAMFIFAARLVRRMILFVGPTDLWRYYS